MRKVSKGPPSLCPSLSPGTTGFHLDKTGLAYMLVYMWVTTIPGCSPQILPFAWAILTSGS